jgi:TPR repeat protein
MLKQIASAATLTMLLLSLATPALAQDENEDCKYTGKNFLRGYLQCLERQDPRYVEKARGFTSMGNLYEFGIKVPKHYGQAAMYYEMACDLADGNGCTYLARLYKIGKGVKKNRRKARDLLKRSFLLN